ncbi:hypothetical protein AB9E28_35565, partial [Rhizobium leguminosarum]
VRHGRLVDGAGLGICAEHLHRQIMLRFEARHDAGAKIEEKIAALEAARIAEGRPSASFATPLKT